MKIIAKIDSDRVLVEMTAREVANVAGLDYEHQLGSPNGCRRITGLEVGTEYDIAAAWKRLKEQEGAAQRLEGVSKTLAALSDLVTQTKVQYVNATAEGSAL